MTPSAIPSDEDLLDRCEVTYFVSSGPGGQHKNRTRTAVRLRHRATGIVVIGRRERSQAQNRADALERLRERLRVHSHRDPPRIATRPTRAARKERRELKKRKSTLKRTRRLDWRAES